MQDSPFFKTNTMADLPTKDLFKFIPQEHSQNFDLGLFNLLSEARSEGYEEEQFAKKLKNRKKSRRL